MKKNKILFLYDPEISYGIKTYQENLFRELDKISKNIYLGYFEENDFTKKFKKKFLIKIPKFCKKLRISIIIYKLFLLDIYLGKKFNNVIIPSQHAPMVKSNKHKRLVTVHDITPLFYGSKLKKIFYKFFLPLSLKNADKIITVSNHSRKDLLKNFKKIPKEKIKTIYSGINPINQKRPLKKQNYFLSIYRNEKWKNSEVLIDSFKNLKFKNLKLIFVGDLPKKENIPNIVFLGNVNSKKLMKLYSQSKAFIYISLYEGFGFPILEAQSWGCPVITSNISSMPEIAGKGAILVNPKNRKEISKTIVKLTKNKKISEKLISEGYKNIKRFSWEKCAKAYLREVKK